MKVDKLQLSSAQWGKANEKLLESKNLFCESWSERPYYYREGISAFWFGGSKLAPLALRAVRRCRRWASAPGAARLVLLTDNVILDESSIWPLLIYQIIISTDWHVQSCTSIEGQQQYYSDRETQARCQQLLIEERTVNITVFYKISILRVVGEGVHPTQHFKLCPLLTLIRRRF